MFFNNIQKYIIIFGLISCSFADELSVFNRWYAPYPVQGRNYSETIFTTGGVSPKRFVFQGGGSGGSIIPGVGQVPGGDRLVANFTIIDFAPGPTYYMFLDADGSAYLRGSYLPGINVPGSRTISIGKLLATDITKVSASLSSNWAMMVKQDGTILPVNAQTDGARVSGFRNVHDVALGSVHGLVLGKDGRVNAFTRNSSGNDYGQADVPAGLSNVVSIAAGTFHSLALTSSGRVIAWGAGEVDDPNSSRHYGQSRVPGNLNGVIAISAGRYHSMALKSNGQVVCWGAGTSSSSVTGARYGYGQSVVPSAVRDAVFISAGERHSAALLRNGEYYIWGEKKNSGRPQNPGGVLSQMALGQHYHLYSGPDLRNPSQSRVDLRGNITGDLYSTGMGLEFAVVDNMGEWADGNGTKIRYSM